MRQWRLLSRSCIDFLGGLSISFCTCIQRHRNCWNIHSEPWLSLRDSYRDSYGVIHLLTDDIRLSQDTKFLIQINHKSTKNKYRGKRIEKKEVHSPSLSVPPLLLPLPAASSLIFSLFFLSFFFLSVSMAVYAKLCFSLPT